jgi:putative sterol carrier protein
MAETREFFDSFMPEKLKANPGLAASVNAVFQFDIKDAGVWTIDLTTPGGAVREGAAAEPGCIITVAKADWEKLLDNPPSAMMLFMTGKLKASNVGLAMQLQKLLA